MLVTMSAKKLVYAVFHVTNSKQTLLMRLQFQVLDLPVGKL